MQAIVVEPSRDAPESVRRIAQAGKLCVMFYGPAANKVSFLTSFAYASQVARAVSTALGPLGDADDPTGPISRLIKTIRAWCWHKSAEIGRKRLFSGQSQPTLSARHRTARPQLISTIMSVLLLLMLCVALTGGFRAPWCRPGILASCLDSSEPCEHADAPDMRAQNVRVTQ